MFLTSVAPDSGSTAGGTQVELRGDGFVEPLRVNIGTGVAPVTSVTPSAITAVTPPSDDPVGDNGTLAVDVTVTAALDQPAPLAATLPGGFVYTESPSQAAFVTSVEPNTGGADGGERVSVRGGGFEGEVQVTFGGNAGSNPSLESAGEITVTVPPPPMPVGSGEILAVDVIVSSGVDQPVAEIATLPGGYSYRADVFVTEVEPNTGGADGGETVRVLGGGFDLPPLSVDFGGNAGLSPVLVSDGEIQVQVPAPPAPVGPGESLAVDVTVTVGLDQTPPLSATLPGGYIYRS